MFDFETGDFENESVTAGNLDGAITNRGTFYTTGAAYNKEGDWFISTLENAQSGRSDGYTGTITSAKFKLTGGDASFLIGGGSSSDLSFSVHLENGTEVYSTNRGSNSEPLELRTIDLSAHVGGVVYWEVKDYSTGGWGYIAVDDIRFNGTLDTTPVIPPPTKGNLVFDFETADFENETVTAGNLGGAITNRATFYTTGQAYNKEGDWFISTLENAQSGRSDGYTGTITSAKFKLTGGDASFLIGGGSSADLSFIIRLENGTIIHSTNRGSNSEPLELRTIDLSAHVGEVVYWEINDYSTGSWGYIAVDSIKFNGEFVDDKLEDNEIDANRIVHITKSNATGFAIDGNKGGDNSQNVYLWKAIQNNVNQQWIEIDRGNGYYTYQKMNTDYALDGGGINEDEENVYLWKVSANNQNQHWQKVDVGGGAFKLILRKTPSLAINGGSGGKNTQNVNLYDSSSTSENLHWVITPVAGAKNIDDLDTDKVLIYPNPVSDIATISNATNSIINIHAINGTLLLSQSISSESETLDLSLLTTGIYYAQINKADSISVVKIVKK